jgi:hypothetical protein
MGDPPTASRPDLVPPPGRGASEDREAAAGVYVTAPAAPRSADLGDQRRPPELWYITCAIGSPDQTGHGATDARMPWVVVSVVGDCRSLSLCSPALLPSPDPLTLTYSRLIH